MAENRRQSHAMGCRLEQCAGDDDLCPSTDMWIYAFVSTYAEWQKRRRSLVTGQSEAGNGRTRIGPVLDFLWEYCREILSLFSLRLNAPLC